MRSAAVCALCFDFNFFIFKLFLRFTMLYFMIMTSEVNDRTFEEGLARRRPSTSYCF